MDAKHKGRIFLSMKTKSDKNKEKGFNEHHFAVAETVKEAVGEVAAAQIDNEGNYMLVVKTEAQAAKLIRIKKLNDGLKVKVERCTNRNQSKAIIYCKMAKDIPDNELEEKLASQKVMKVKSIPPQKTLKIITFQTSEPPEHIDIGLIKIKTQPYYPMPKVCRNCQSIGHITTNCNRAKRCSKCYGLHPEPNNCKNKIKCGSCGGENHVPLAKTCPVYVQEKAIIKIQVDQRITPSEARNIYRRNNGETYLPITKRTTETRSEDEETDKGGESEEDVVLMGEDALGHPPRVPRPIKEEPKKRKRTSKEIRKTTDEDTEEPGNSPERDTLQAREEEKPTTSGASSAKKSKTRAKSFDMEAAVDKIVTRASLGNL